MMQSKAELLVAAREAQLSHSLHAYCSLLFANTVGYDRTKCRTRWPACKRAAIAGCPVSHRVADVEHRIRTPSRCRCGAKT